MLLLHISDIHFSTGDIDKPYDQNLGLRGDMIQDVKGMRKQLNRPIDAILISGDIAYHGRKEEFDFALTWLKEELCPVSGCKIEDVVVIPGNHDVDRKAAEAPMHADARAMLRSTPISQANQAITRYVDDETSSQMLFKPIENYNRFSANFLCEIGFYNKDTGRKPYTFRDFTLSDGSTLRVWGFNSVLICDGKDGKDNMFVDPSAAQIIKREDGVTHLVMCHHPFGWLRNAGEFRDRIESVAHLHLFGHEHSLRVEDYRRFTRIRAGALQPSRDEAGWQPGYNIIDVDVSGRAHDRRLDVKIWVRHYHGTRFIAVSDHQGNDPWHLSHDLTPWIAPKVEASPIAPVAQIGAGPTNENTGTVMVDQSLTVRSVAIKILALNEKDQRRIITGLALDEEGDQGLLDYEFALAAVRRAFDRGQLQQLNDAIVNQPGVR
ncbi:metallophosphoesterase [Mesorhizobium sp. M1B.F.Ca.ET.045.04.1.1]|uniref:metallophosphoesterase n=1 Tax=Mesorhizobium sp. M1B.F.Ca.ET.045.04.1.1 TaxID=2493673 RepID=UPI000F75B1ED|nr:metallophosphoesterase [Mesorhizobium sp. M1B.F.Ca.ET.045.04.1.1]AZO30807.1 metallophosphoesterase [Mesorhizobium sp. M1B.F.Ca.ET.045.04.1.1]